MPNKLIRRELVLKDIIIAVGSYILLSGVIVLIIFFLTVFFSKDEGEQFLFDIILTGITACSSILSSVLAILRIFNRIHINSPILIGSFNIALLASMSMLGFRGVSNLFVLCFVVNVASLILCSLIVITSVKLLRKVAKVQVSDTTKVQ